MILPTTPPTTIMLDDFIYSAIHTSQYYGMPSRILSSHVCTHHKPHTHTGALPHQSPEECTGYYEDTWWAFHKKLSVSVEMVVQNPAFIDSIGRLQGEKNIFSGDLGRDSIDGLERLTGWDSSFYETVNGRAESISYKLLLNPFYFNISAAVNSAPLSSLEDLGYSNINDGSTVNAGDGWVAFALSCKATVYDATFSLINGSIAGFNATLSDPREASIIKAPLQVGLGQDSLYQQASLAVLSGNSRKFHGPGYQPDRPRASFRRI